MDCTIIAPRIFDGTVIHKDAALVVEGGIVTSIQPRSGIRPGSDVAEYDGLITPGFVDLQVNGGGGVMLNDTPDVDGLRRISEAHLRLGSTTILPTLISDSADVTRAAIAAVQQGVAQGIPGIAGLHLEGPHLSVARKGAHEARFLRPMNDDDLALYYMAAGALPALMLTVAPEVVSPLQIYELTKAGVIVSLGHTDADYDTCRTAHQAGARCITHLFNAMSPLAHRAPGCVGAALDSDMACGVIADGIHVDTAALRIALAARPEGLFAVSDAMAVAGTHDHVFILNGRRVFRQNGQLTLKDGTLAGADLTLPRAVQVLTDQAGVTPERALAMVTSIPAGVAGLKDAGHLHPGAPANFMAMTDDFTLQEVWQNGSPAMQRT